jgi:uncharacterized protein with HEPN domain
MRDDRERLLDILEAIGKIEQRACGRDSFLADELLQVWVIHHIQIIGEAASGLSAEFRERFPSIPWADIIAMRNVLVHQYFGIDREEVWASVQTDIPALKASVSSILKDLV